MRTTLVPAVVAVSIAVGSIPLKSQAAIEALLTIPLGLDLYMPAPEDNPITSDKVALGRRLFNDRRLSRDGTVACVSCHDPDRAFSTADAISGHLRLLRTSRTTARLDPLAKLPACGLVVGTFLATSQLIKACLHVGTKLLPRLVTFFQKPDRASRAYASQDA